MAPALPQSAGARLLLGPRPFGCPGERHQDPGDHDHFRVAEDFTDRNDREGPDHKFAMNPANWARMVEETRVLERSLGSPDKFIAENEKDTSVVQRRCLRAARAVKQGEVFTREMIDVLRPATPGAIKPYEITGVIGTRALHDFALGQELRWTDLGAA